jgi:hypothetical protein
MSFEVLMSREATLTNLALEWLEGRSSFGQIGSRGDGSHVDDVCNTVQSAGNAYRQARLEQPAERLRSIFPAIR